MGDTKESRDAKALADEQRERERDIEEAREYELSAEERREAFEDFDDGE